MSDYIKREDVLSMAISMYIEYYDGETGYVEEAENLVVTVVDIKNLPAADVVEVVRCKDCKWCHSGYCEMYDDLIPFGCANRPWEEWFCADGARMDGDS